MNKIKPYLSYILVSIVGSVLTFYLGSFIFADIGNNAYGWNGWNVLVTIPAVMLCFQFIALSMFIVRFYRGLEYKNRTILLYLRIIIVFSIIGIIGVFLSAMYSYGTLFTKYPFPYFLILFLVLNIVIIIGSILIYRNTTKKVYGWERKKITVGYVLYSIFIAGFTFFSYYKFGALLLSPLYIQTSTLYMTWPVYVWLAIPMLILNCIVMTKLRVLADYIDTIIYLLLLLFLNICLSVTYFVTSYYNSLFVSAISPAFGLDRLATNPYVAMFHAVITTIVIVVYLIICFVKLIKNKDIYGIKIGLCFIVFFIALTTAVSLISNHDILDVISGYASYYSSPAKEPSNLYHDYIYNLPCTYQETAEDGKVIYIMNLDERFGCIEAKDGTEAQEIIDGDVIAKCYGDYFHHNTNEFLDYFWAFSSFDKIILNNKEYRCDEYTEGIHNLDTLVLYSKDGKLLYNDGIIQFVTCQGDGYSSEGRFIAILSEIK